MGVAPLWEEALPRWRSWEERGGGAVPLRVPRAGAASCLHMCARLGMRTKFPPCIKSSLCSQCKQHKQSEAGCAPPQAMCWNIARCRSTHTPSLQSTPPSQSFGGAATVPPTTGAPRRTRASGRRSSQS